MTIRLTSAQSAISARSTWRRFGPCSSRCCTWLARWALRRRMPHRDFIYLGDTARVPYGRKPPEMVVEFACGIADFLCGLGIDGLVVACNTATAVALPQLQERCSVPVWGVIDAGVEAATRATASPARWA